LELGCRRAWRWQARRAGGRLEDLPAGGNPVHGLLAWEQDEIVKLFEQWGQVDRCHRKLAHRGCYLHRVWGSPSSVCRVLAAGGCGCAVHHDPDGHNGARFLHGSPTPDTRSGSMPQRILRGCPDVAATMIMDLVTRKWLATIVSAEQTPRRSR
jgi:putative transposase